MVAHLLNIDATLAQTVADGLGLKALPKAADAARPTKMDLEPSDLLSSLKNPPDSFAGRKLGILITDGTDAKLLAALLAAAAGEGTAVELIAPAVGGVTLSDGSVQAAHHQIDGGPSVLFDAVALLPAEEAILSLLKLPPARDFVSDAYAHYKFIGFTAPAAKLFAKVGLPEDLDEGFITLEGADDAEELIAACRALRFWDRPDGA